MRTTIIEQQYASGDSFNYYFMSDLHLDSPEHDRKLLIRELDYALSKKASIFIGGDIFDFLLNGDRKRYTPSRNKYGAEDAAVNFALEEAYTTLKPYAKNIKVVLCGNHEVSMMKFHSIDPLVILICKLNELEGVHIEYLGYQGYIRLAYKYKKGASAQSFDIKAHHGTGGSSEITKGTITLSRFMNAHIADLYWSGHTHTKVVLPDENCTYLDQYGNINVRSRKGLITGAYVHASQYEPSTHNGQAKPYHVSYGDLKRTLQSTGSILMEQTFVNKEEMITRIIC